MHMGMFLTPFGVSHGMDGVPDGLLSSRRSIIDG